MPADLVRRRVTGFAQGETAYGVSCWFSKSMQRIQINVVKKLDNSVLNV